MAKQMVRPRKVQVDVEPVERGTGVKIQCELAQETRDRLALEQMRRRRQGLPATVEAIMRELIESASREWPTPPEEGEETKKLQE